MLFLQPLYEYIFHHYAAHINHFALIKLILYSLDKTLFYFIIFVIIRLCWLLLVRHRRTLKSEACVWVFSFYIILLLMLTVFRDTYFPWQLTFNFHRSLSDINLVFMKETLKLTHGQSLLDFFIIRLEMFYGSSHLVSYFLQLFRKKVWWEPFWLGDVYP